MCDGDTRRACSSPGRATWAAAQNAIADGSRPCDALASANHADKESCCGPRLGRVIAEFTPTEQLNLVRLDDPWNFHSLSQMVRDARSAGLVSAPWARRFDRLLDTHYGGRWAAKVRAFYNGERATLPGRPSSNDQRSSNYHSDGVFARMLCRLIALHFDGALRVHGYVAGKVRMRYGVLHAEAAVCTANAAFVRTKIYDEEVCTRFWYQSNLPADTPDEHVHNAPVKPESPAWQTARALRGDRRPQRADHQVRRPRSVVYSA